MASITSLSNSSYNMSSIYGNRNVLSGLASGMDTESMIENAVSGIKLKIQNLQVKRTKIEWQQEAYRSIIDKAVNFNNKYTSYSSKTNLMSNSFFSNAVNTVALGTYADKVSASGKTSSDIKINGVKQLATSASYTVTGLGGMSSGEIKGITGGEKFDISGKIPVSTVSGMLSFQYGGTNGTSFDISFDELENLDEIEVYDDAGELVKDPTATQKLAQAIQNKLDDVTYNYTKNGFQESTTAGKAIKVKVDGMNISFEDGLGNGNKVTLSASGDIKGTLGIGKEDTSIKVNYDTTLSKEKPMVEYLEDKELGFTLNGSTKKINLGEVIEKAKLSSGSGDVASAVNNAAFQAALQKELDGAFGKGRIKVGEDTDGALTFTPSGKGDTLSIGGSGAEAMGFETGDSNFINAGKKLVDILGGNAEKIFTSENRLKGAGGAIEKTSPNGSTYYVDKAGNRVDKDGYRVDKDNKAIYDLEINGAHINITEDTTLESMMNAINSNAEAGMKVSYSKLTNEFKFTATETGANSKVEFGKLAEALFVNHDRTAANSFADTFGIEEMGKSIGFEIEGVGKLEFGNTFTQESTIEDVVNKLNEHLSTNEHMTASFDKLSGQIIITDDKTGKMMDFKMLDEKGGEYELPDFGSSYTSGQDAIMDVEINGVRFEDLTRSSNTFDIDGMNITVKDTFTTGVDKDGKPEEAVTFKTTTDSDKIVEAIAS